MAEDGQRARPAAAAVAAQHPRLLLVVLFGSRARGDARPVSDWDVGYLADGPVDPLALRRDLADGLGTDRLDLVDLARASALLRYRAARDGVALFEREPGAFSRFWMTVVRFWCEVAPLVEAANAVTLGEGRE